jgi:formylmethanofuran dehydrogenase subunit C
MGFNRTGVVKNNPSNLYDAANSIVVDSDFIYVAGYDESVSPTDEQWRIEKRDKITGELVPAFNTTGVVLSNPSSSADFATSMVADSDYIYVVGYDSYGGDHRWRIEKRNKINGALVTAFNTTGVVISDPSSGADRAYSITIDSSYIYIAGFDCTPGSNVQWRIEKRNKTSGALVTAFDSDGVVESNPTTLSDIAYGIAVDSNYLFVAGSDYGGGNKGWRIMKFDKTTGGLFSNFGSNGVIQINPSSGQEYATAITVDSNYFYVTGEGVDSGYYQWRVEKRNKITGNLVTAFDSDGIIQSAVFNETGGSGKPYTITLDSNYIYVAGYDRSPDNEQWRVEKRNKTTGELLNAFNNDGVVQSDDGAGPDIANSIAIDSNYIYVAGFDYSPGNYQWRIEKYKNNVYPDTGAYTSPIIEASGVDNVVWSTLSWHSEVLPPDTDLKFQLAACDDGATWEYLGPDGTKDTYYETAAGQPIWSGLSGKYLRYKAYFSTTDTAYSPTLDDVKITFLEVEPPIIKLTSPNGGEDWMRNSWYPITWSSQGNFNSTPVCLYYSLDNGETWNTIENYTENTGHYNWTVPDSETANALVKVTIIDISNNMVGDTSDASFAIDPPPPGASAGGVPSGGGGSQFPPDDQPGTGAENPGDGAGEANEPEGIDTVLALGILILVIVITISIIINGYFFKMRNKKLKEGNVKSKILHSKFKNYRGK